MAWLASRLDLAVVETLHAPSGSDADASTGDTELGAPMIGGLRAGRRHIPVEVVPLESPMPGGTTLAVEIAAERRSAKLRLAVTAEADAVICRAELDGDSLPERRFMAPRRTEVELLAETVDSVGRDPVATAALQAAAELVGRA